MRLSTRLLMFPVLVGLSASSEASAQAHAAHRPVAASESTTVSVRWNRLAPRFSEEAAAVRRAARAAAAAAGDSSTVRRIAQTPPLMPFRLYTLLSLAQYAAVDATRGRKDVAAEAVVAAASATVLTELFTDTTVRASIAGELARDLDRARSSRTPDQVAAASRLGEDVARRVIARTPTPNMVSPWNGSIPTGPGMWYSARGVPPLGVGLSAARTLLLDSAAQFRPDPPPAFGSPAFQAALEDVRRVARERTPEQTAIAQRWNSADPWAMWNETASAILVRRRVPEPEAARVLAVLNAAATDAIIACFVAKYNHWTIRPSQVDTTLVLADKVTLPNFPAYPSGHACSAGAFDAVLGHFFPGQRAEFTRIAEEQAMSRLYAGVHYRFDNDAGLALGRTVARYGIEKERRGGLKGR